jgi:hypothetical protein
MSNPKIVENLVTAALTVLAISLCFGCEAQPQTNSQTTINATKKVQFNVDLTSGFQKGTYNNFH